MLEDIMKNVKTVKGLWIDNERSCYYICSDNNLFDCHREHVKGKKEERREGSVGFWWGFGTGPPAKWCTNLLLLL